ncbi:hypothetical protein F5877DRAFT_52660, partial [Lentinula edodes]
DGMRVYQESKTLADKAIWDISCCHLDVDFTVLLPPAIFGPQLSPLAFSPSSLGANGFVKMLSAPEYSPIPIGHMIDVRDAARAHCPRAFDSPGSRARQEVQHRQWDAKMQRRHGVDVDQ